MPTDESATALLTVYGDAVHAALDQFGRRTNIGWFRDEVSAASAAMERLLMQSALLPTLRKLPQLKIVPTYCQKKNCRQPVEKYARATVVKADPLGRRVVFLPGAGTKSWVTAA